MISFCLSLTPQIFLFLALKSKSLQPNESFVILDIKQLFSPKDPCSFFLPSLLSLGPNDSRVVSPSKTRMEGCFHT